MKGIIGVTGPTEHATCSKPLTIIPFTKFAEERTDLAVKVFCERSFPDVRSANVFFQDYGIGNDPNQANIPYERFYYYNLLLTKLAKTNPIKYMEIHKGNPFYFLGWTAFDFGDYDKAVFFMDAAFAEDHKNVSEWDKTPAAQFLTLEEGGNQAAASITNKLRRLVITEFDRFNNIPGHYPLIISEFVTKFIRRIWTQPDARSIITALYSFILEFPDRLQTLGLRGHAKGSIEPFLVHLFKGGLIVESIVKQLYILKNEKETLRGIFKYPEFKADFSITDSIDISATNLGVIIAFAKTGETPRIAFATTGKIRNTSGHNLAWPDVFEDLNNYELIYRQIMNSVFFIIAKKYIDP